MCLVLLESLPENHSGTPIIAQRSSNQKAQAEKAGAKEPNVSKPEEPYKE